jgi:hypothetical protein
MISFCLVHFFSFIFSNFLKFDFFYNCNLMVFTKNKKKETYTNFLVHKKSAGFQQVLNPWLAPQNHRHSTSPKSLCKSPTVSPIPYVKSRASHPGILGS